jgi:hypothetical protein
MFLYLTPLPLFNVSLIVTLLSEIKCSPQYGNPIETIFLHFVFSLKFLILLFLLKFYFLINFVYKFMHELFLH